MKKIFSNFYVSFVSFIAGMLFIIQCGGGASSIAQNAIETVASALGISYDNSNSNLESKNVQDALNEIERGLPAVYDANGEKVGIYLSAPGSTDWEIFDLKNRIALLVDPGIGQINDNGIYLYYASDDCSGQPFMQNNWPQRWENTTYAPAKISGSLAGRDVRSTSGGTGTCFPATHIGVEFEYKLVPAQQIETPSYAAPLTIR